MNNVIIEAKNIFKTYSNLEEKKVEVLKDVSINIELGKITMIVGASGAGKSTLLHILSGLDKPDSGEVSFSNTNLFKLNDDSLSRFRNQNMGFIFQFHHLLPEFTAAENVAIAKMIDGSSLSDSLKLASEILELVGLSERASHKPAELSGGEQQRVAIARALINKPDIIFADEPTGNLDSQNSQVVHNLFLKLKNELGLTFLVVTHNPELVKIGDTVQEMKDGKLIG